MATREYVIAALCDVWKALEDFLDGLLANSKHGNRVNTRLIDFEPLCIQSCKH